VNCRMSERYSVRGGETKRESRSHGKFHSSLRASWATCCLVFGLVLTCVLADPLPSEGRKKDGIAWGEGLIVNIPLPAPEVAQVVGDIAANGIIRGTKEYNRDEFVTGAKAADSSKVFGEWKQGGEVFYKVREEALDPRNFKDSGDLGTLAVRYVVKPQGAKNAILRIDALFQEEIRRTVHESNGSVESAEYRDIQDHLDFIELVKKQDAEAARERQEKLARKRNGAAQTPPAPVASSSSYRPSLNAPPVGDNSTPAAPPAAATTIEPAGAPAPVVAANSPPSGAPQPGEDSTPAPPTTSNSATNVTARPAENVAPPAATSSAPLPGAADSAPTPSPAAVPPPAAAQPDSPKVSSGSFRPDQSLEQQVAELRRQVERLVKAPGAPLKSAPFHTAGTLESLPEGTQVLIVISTPYWYGVETHDGQHGWIMRDELEQIR
jgi:hypothetical protein